MMKLEGQVAIVTGSSRGIGRAVALELARAGAVVAVNYLSHHDLASELAAQIHKDGGTALAIKADVSDFNEVTRMVDSVLQQCGRIDILVNNAGVTADKSFAKMTPEMWQRVLAVNLNGTFNCCKAVVPHMTSAGRGRIVNISSIVGQIGNFGQTNYAASKAAVIGLTKSLARELCSKGITVNAVAPGFIETSMLEAIPNPVKQSILAQIPLKRFGKPEEVARCIRYLVSEDGSYIMGQVININGGMFM
jgi:3-oxoacyl-(acyl-carrier-protein) reductase